MATVVTWKLRSPCSRSALYKVVPLAPPANFAPSLRADGKMLNTAVSDMFIQLAVWPEGFCFTCLETQDAGELFLGNCLDRPFKVTLSCPGNPTNQTSMNHLWKGFKMVVPEKLVSLDSFRKCFAQGDSSGRAAGIALGL